MKKNILFIVIAFIALSSCKHLEEHHHDNKGEDQKLMQTSKDWSMAAQTDSIEKIVSYWTDDATVMEPGHPPIKGKEAIREMVKSMKSMPGFKISWEPLSAVVSESGDLGYMLEKNTVTVPDSLGKAQTSSHDALTIWKKQADGSWKCVVDMWN